MVQITGGKVSFSRTVQKSQYEPCRAEVTIDFIVPEGTEFSNQLDQAADYAQRKALEMVNGSAAPKAAAAPAPKVEASKPDAKADAAANLTAREKKAAEQANKAKTPPKASVPASGQAISTGEDRMPASDDLSDVLGAAAPITDKDLVAAINHRAGELTKTMKEAASPAIRKLIAEFAGPLPKRAGDIPQEKRQEFLDKLKALK